jgi:hypothetical protein
VGAAIAARRPRIVDERGFGGRAGDGRGVLQAEPDAAVAEDSDALERVTVDDDVALFAEISNECDEICDAFPAIRPKEPTPGTRSVAILPLTDVCVAPHRAAPTPPVDQAAEVSAAAVCSASSVSSWDSDVPPICVSWSEIAGAVSLCSHHGDRCFARIQVDGDARLVGIGQAQVLVVGGSSDRAADDADAEERGPERNRTPPMAAPMPVLRAPTLSCLSLRWKDVRPASPTRKTVTATAFRTRRCATTARASPICAKRLAACSPGR